MKSNSDLTSKGVNRNKSGGGRNFFCPPPIGAQNLESKFKTFGFLYISIRYFKGTQSPITLQLLYFISPSKKTIVEKNSKLFLNVLYSSVLDLKSGISLSSGGGGVCPPPITGLEAGTAPFLPCIHPHGGGAGNFLKNIPCKIKI